MTVRADAQDRPLTLHADPQVTVIEREVHAVIFERHRIVEFGGLHDLNLLMPTSYPPGMPGARLSSRTEPVMMTDDSCGRCEIGLKEFGRQVTFEGDALDEARPIAHEQKDNLPLSVRL